MIGLSFTYRKNDTFYSTDMMFSIQTGLDQLPFCDNFFLVPGDMPMISPKTYLLLKSNWKKNDKILCPWIDNRKRHPILIAYDFVPCMKIYQGNDGFRGLLRENPDSVRTIEISDAGCLIDLDTMIDYSLIQKNKPKL